MSQNLQANSGPKRHNYEWV